MKIKIGIVDDQKLILASLESYLNTYSDFKVVLNAVSGDELFQKLRQQDLIPDILLIDVLMPQMNGFEIAGQIKKDYPQMKTVALSILDNPISIINMIKAGCSTYLLKSMNPQEIILALNEVWNKGRYNSRFTDLNYLKDYYQFDISEREMEFLELVCSELTYYQIASEMCLSIKTIDGYRAALFERFKVKNRVGLVLKAIENNLISIHQKGHS